MKKSSALLIAIVILSISLAGCNLTGGGSFNPATEAEFLRDGIVENVEELEEVVALMSDNFSMSARVQLRSIDIWDELSEFYAANTHILAVRGISGMQIAYHEVRGVVEAELLPVYEMFMRLIVAHESRNLSALSSDERRVFDLAEQIVKENKKNTVFETAHALHVYLKDNIVYEHNHESNQNAFNIYGALIEGRAVCQGYAQSYRVLLHMANIENLLITGRANGELHAWNMVNYGARGNPLWYHVDVTWNDLEEVQSNRYFNVSDRIISASHTWERSAFPAANSTQFNYFRYTAMAAAVVSDLEAIFASKQDRGERYIEILCTFNVGSEHLTFLQSYGYTGVSYSIEVYGDDRLLILHL